MRYFILVGEASGDLHGANLMKAIKRLDPNAEFCFWGGDLMEQEGGKNLNHIKERAFMGFLEVIKNLFKIKAFIGEAKKDIEQYQPDRVIFIDYPGFNLRIANWAHANGHKTYYYISPKVWAWNTKRALKIKENIDKLFVILPFEVAFYQSYQYEVEYVGNPLMDAIENFKADSNFLASIVQDKKPIIALLPGSRKQELESILPSMLQAVKTFKKDYHIVLAMAPNFEQSFYQSFKDIENVILVKNQTYDLLSVSQAALVTSGTATLETALLNVPQVVCYKTSSINYAIAKQLIKVKYISLVNLIADQELVKELIQTEMTVDNLQNELKNILSGTGREAQLKGYLALQKIIGPAGASQRVADSVVKGL